MTVDDVFEFIHNAKFFVLTTVDGDQPCVRPLCYTAMYDGGIYLFTSKKKAMYHQLQRNSKFEIFCIEKNRWVRIKGRLFADRREEVKKALFDQNTSYDDLRPPLSYMQDNPEDIVPLRMTDCSALFYDILEQQELVLFS